MVYFVIDWVIGTRIFRGGDNMLPIERLNLIKELIKERQNMKISELSKELGVSEMTIHRDLKPLVEEGLIIKTFGGISLVQKEKKVKKSSDLCVYCSRAIHERMGYRLILPNNEIEMACCAHCGLLRHRQLENNIVQAICSDFFKQTTISAPLAWYVIDTSIDMGCCNPQVLTFERKEHADKFVKGFGGVVYSFTEAMEEIFKRMNQPGSCCHSHPEQH